MRHIEECQRPHADGPCGWNEYRAIIRRPASILDTPEDRAIGHVDEYGPPFKTKAEARAQVTRNSTESHAYVLGYQHREVTADHWRDQ